MVERITAKHPDRGEAGVNIRKEKHELIRDAILEVVEAEVFFKDLPRKVENRLKGAFDGSISWYVTTVKLDLETRGMIERIPKSSPQKLRLHSG